MELGPNQSKWLAELESGNCNQTTGVLKREEADGSVGYCCLGVAIELFSRFDHVPSGKYFNLDGNPHYASNDIVELLQLNDREGSFTYEEVVINDVYYSSLADMNDGGISFKDIAAYIRSNPQNVFTQPS